MLIWQLATLMAYFVKGVCGFASTLVFSSIVSFGGTANIAITPVDLLLGMPANLFMGWKYRKKTSLKAILPLICLILVSSALGIFMLKSMDTGAIKSLFGVMLVGMGLQSILTNRNTEKKKTSKVLLWLICILSGVMTGLFGVGALLAAYFSRTCPDTQTFKANMCLIFLTENCFRIIAYIFTGILTPALLLQALTLAPAMGVGLLIGMKCAGKLNEKQIRLIVNLFLIISGFVLLWGQLAARL